AAGACSVGSRIHRDHGRAYKRGRDVRQPRRALAERFAMNDELNVAVYDSAFAAWLQRVFDEDLTRAEPITAESWARRPLTSRLHEFSRTRCGRLLKDPPPPRPSPKKREGARLDSILDGERLGEPPVRLQRIAEFLVARRVVRAREQERVARAGR